MKKKIISGIAAFAMLVTPFNVFAEDVTTVDQDTDPPTAEAEILTDIGIEYTVTIPTGVTVQFMDEETHFGYVEMTKLRAEVNKGVEVTVTYDGKLRNSDDADTAIAYSLTADKAALPSGDSFLFTEAGQQRDLDVIITEEEWNKAPAGSYGGTVTFDVAYVDVLS